MATIAENLQSIKNSKAAIKAAIEAKGVPVGELPFADYAGKIEEISGGGGTLFNPNTMLLRALTNITIVKEDSDIAKAAEKVTYMSSCFYGCSALTSISLPALPNVTSMGTCFNGCSALTSISLPELPKVTSMGNCFGGCSALTSISLPALPNVINMAGCFYNCSRLTSISLPALPNVTYMSSCFYGCSALTSISLPEFPKVTSMGNCFYGCSALTSISLPALPDVTYMSSCFYGCSALQNLTIGTLNTALSNLSTCGLSYCTLLTIESLLNVINALPTRTGTNILTIGITNLNKLTDEQKAIATDKGWTLD